ncbi:hypothetical protein ABFX02_10G023600 [Erythranthe guttata]
MEHGLLPYDSDLYLSSFDAPYLSSPELRLRPGEQTTGYIVGVLRGFYTEHVSNVHRQVLDEVEIRELLIEHVGHRCCWGSRPARTWHIHAVEDCNVYIGTLETFIVERETVTEIVPDRLLPNAVDTKSEAPVLFTPRGESRTVIPESEECVRCPACASCGALGKKFCPTCNADKLFRELKVKCPACNGSGVDGSDYVETLVARKVIATRGGAFVPDNVFEKAKGLQLFSTQSRKCSPATFADSNFLNQFSSEIIAARAPMPAIAKTIRERHNISVIPITKLSFVVDVLCSKKAKSLAPRAPIPWPDKD